MPGRRAHSTRSQYKVASQFEADVLDWLTTNNVPFEYETETLHYATPVQKGLCGNCGSDCCVIQRRTYTPDVKLPDGSFVEIKGVFPAHKRNLMRQVVKANPDKKFRFIFLTDPWLTKAKKTKLSDWAKSLGCEYHIWNPKGGKKMQQHFVPEEWLNG